MIRRFDVARIAYFSVLTASLLLMVASPARGEEADSLYVGTEACKSCHQHAFTTWTMSDHARAGLVFGMMAGQMMMRRAMEATYPAEEYCRQCHAPPGTETSATFGPMYHPEDGVQCETCHGPGGEHARIEAAKDTLGGHRIFVAKEKRDLCQRCHYDEKPFHDRQMLRLPTFDYDQWWPRIVHLTPDSSGARR